MRNLLSFCLFVEAKDIHNLRRKMSKEQFEAPLKCLLELFLPFLIPLEQKLLNTDLEKPHFNTSIWKVPRKQEPYMLLLCVDHKQKIKLGDRMGCRKAP